LQNENGLLTADSEKFQKILQQYEGRKKKLIDTIAYEKAELATGGMTLTMIIATLELILVGIGRYSLGAA
jgi:kinetochore protein NDC80